MQELLLKKKQQFQLASRNKYKVTPQTHLIKNDEWPSRLSLSLILKVNKYARVNEADADCFRRWRRWHEGKQQMFIN